MPIRTKLTDLLGIEAPIIQGGMQYVGYAYVLSFMTRSRRRVLGTSISIISIEQTPLNRRSRLSPSNKLAQSSISIISIEQTHSQINHREMASAVSEAGGLGILTALTQPSPEALRKEIRRTRGMTNKPFGVNLTILKMLIPADYDAYARVIAEEKVKMVEVAGGSPKKYIKMWHDAGVLVLHKSATMRHALKAQAAGVDIIEVVGYGASIAGGQPGDEIG